MATACVVRPMFPGMKRLSLRCVAVTRTAFAVAYAVETTGVKDLVAASAKPSSTTMLFPAAVSAGSKSFRNADFCAISRV